MNYLLVVLFVYTFFSICTISNAVDQCVEEALFLTDLIENGLIDEAKRLALVLHPELKNIISYSGFITVDKSTNSNIFFWYFPSQSNPAKDPLVTFTPGGPMHPGLLGNFGEFGPFIATRNQTLEIREYSLTNNHNVVFLDIPIGVGFSFVDNKAGYATTLADVGRNYYNFIIQFFQLFPEHQENDFYIAGDSEACRHVITLANIIRNQDAKENARFNLKGIMIGGGIYDLKYQYAKADFLYQIGLIDFNGRDLIYKMEKNANKLRCIENIDDPQMITSLNSWATNMDLNITYNLIQNLTGFQNIKLNFLEPNNPGIFLYEKWIKRTDVRKAIHVGDYSYSRESVIAKNILHSVLYDSISPAFIDLLNDPNYKVLIYSGQLDMKSPYTQLQNYLLNLPWLGLEDYKSAARMKWKVNGELAGYWKIARNLNEVFIIKAGRLSPFYQPFLTLKMITSFTRNTISKSL